jgi:hypothetical protein
MLGLSAATSASLAGAAAAAAVDLIAAEIARAICGHGTKAAKRSSRRLNRVQQCSANCCGKLVQDKLTNSTYTHRDTSLQDACPKA